MLKKCAIAATLAACCIPGIAGAGTGAGKVKMIMAHAPDIVIFRVEAHANKPACNTAGDDFALSLTTQAGRAQYSMLLAAAAQDKTVSVQGSGACLAPTDRESPTYISIDY